MLCCTAAILVFMLSFQMYLATQQLIGNEAVCPRLLAKYYMWNNFALHKCSGLRGSSQFCSSYGSWRSPSTLQGQWNIQAWICGVSLAPHDSPIVHPHPSHPASVLTCYELGDSEMVLEEFWASSTSGDVDPARKSCENASVRKQQLKGMLSGMYWNWKGRIQVLSLV